MLHPIPVALSNISISVETNGKLGSGQTLNDAISLVDAETDNTPAYNMRNCIHPLDYEGPEVWCALQQETWGKVPSKLMESEQVIILFVLISHNNRIDGDAVEAQATYEWTKSAIALCKV